jgi:hypothetical protein
MSPVAVRAFLRIYPRSWRERYGDELIELIHEARTNGDRSEFRLGLNVFKAGSVERLRSVGLLNTGVTSNEKVQSGVQQILWSWIIFVIGGIGVAKAAEYWTSAVPPTKRLLPTVAFNALIIGSIFGTCAVIFGLILSTRPLVIFLRSGGWKKIRRYVLSATALTIVATVALVLLSGWAHYLTQTQRNGSDTLYMVAILIWIFIFISGLVAWTIAAVVTARELDFKGRLLNIQALLSLFLVAAMFLMLIGTSIWWGALARTAPWFLAGTASGTRGTSIPVNLVVAISFMLAGTALGMAGAFSVQRNVRIANFR